nr:V-type ATP synthase subunit E family protein [Sedimentibacter sp.]
MVTIEQKLLLFSKLIHQSMDKKFAEELEEVEKQYKEKLQKSKDDVEKEVKDIIENARKKVEEGKIEILSKTKINIKKETMAVKEKYYRTLMAKLKESLKEFSDSEKYEKYLQKGIEKFNNEMSNVEGTNLVIYLTEKDNEKYSKLIKESLESKHNYKSINFKIVDDSIVGGIIIDFPDKNIRIDMTIESILEENETYIMQTLFESLEAGEYSGI